VGAGEHRVRARVRALARPQRDEQAAGEIARGSRRGGDAERGDGDEECALQV
jgi:hypothetical protein